MRAAHRNNRGEAAIRRRRFDDTVGVKALDAYRKQGRLIAGGGFTKSGPSATRGRAFAMSGEPFNGPVHA